MNNLANQTALKILSISRAIRKNAPAPVAAKPEIQRIMRTADGFAYQRADGTTGFAEFKRDGEDPVAKAVQDVQQAMQGTGGGLPPIGESGLDPQTALTGGSPLTALIKGQNGGQNDQM